MRQGTETAGGTATAELDIERHEDATDLTIPHYDSADCDAGEIVSGLASDQPVLVRNVTPHEADRIICEVASALDLSAQLELQAAFASIHGHRSGVGKYFMTVNTREDYQFIPSHSEGDARAGIQLACLYCNENTTDGGVTILLNTDDSSPMWELLRGVENKVDLCGRKLSASEIAIARMRYQIYLPDDILGDTDQVLSERECPIPGLRMFKALTRTRKIKSRILDRELNVYWDNVASFDFDSGKEYFDMLRSDGLLREPPQGMRLDQYDNNQPRRAWSSGVDYASLFKSKVVRKLRAGEMVVFNNLTWTHSTSNWTPGSGHRKVAVAFA